jgi:uncharacterized protein YjbK
MNTKEYEKKLLLSETEYAIVRELFFRGENATTTDQVNYYFDTSGQDFHRKGITCRIRQKNGNLKGTIKTHLSDQKDVSKEENFAVEALPYRFILSSQIVYLQGSLYTRRSEVEIMPGIRMMLDQNWYLGIVDYELEIEYLPFLAAQVEGVMSAIMNMLHHTSKKTEQLSKSHRFFLRKNDLPDKAVKPND